VNLATIGWPSGTDTGWPSEPRNMLPGRIEGYPQGSQRSANTAERLLSQAVGWWDAAAYRDGDRLLRNRGVAGELLDLQLGSSDRVATTNDPLFLAPEDTGFVYLPGVTGNTLRVPDENALDITGDIDIRFQASFDSWPQPNLTEYVGKWRSAGDLGGYVFGQSGNNLFFTWYAADGTGAGTATSTAAPVVTPGIPTWLRATLDVDNGAGTPQYEVRFFTSLDGVNWTQVGTTVTGTTGVTSIGAGTRALDIGSRAGADRTITGKVYAAQIWDGIEGSGGTKVLDVDCDAITDGSATSFTAVTNQTVTINRSTSNRKAVAVPRRNGGGRSLFLLGADDYMQVQNTWQHQLLKTEPGDALTVVLVSREWATASFAPFISKQSNLSGVHVGWTLYSNGTSIFLYQSDGLLVLQPQVTWSPGATRVAVGQRFPVERITQIRTEQFTSSPVATSAQATINSPLQRLTIGKMSGVVTYSNLEFIAAAIFRKALTPDEIKTITDYYQNRGY